MMKANQTMLIFSGKVWEFTVILPKQSIKFLIDVGVIHLILKIGVAVNIKW